MLRKGMNLSPIFLAYVSNQPSLQILNAYDENHLSFVKQVLKDPLYLEEITGLAAMKKESESLLEDWDIENDDEDDF